MVEPQPSQYDQDMAARIARDDRHKGIKVDDEPRDEVRFSIKYTDEVEKSRKLQRRLDDVDPRLETCLTQRDNLMKLCEEKNIPHGLNLDPNPQSDEDDEPRPPSYKSSDEESE